MDSFKGGKMKRETTTEELSKTILKKLLKDEYAFDMLMIAQEKTYNEAIKEVSRNIIKEINEKLERKLTTKVQNQKSLKER